MKGFKLILLAGMAVTLTSTTTLAVPLDITLTGGTPVNYFGNPWAGAYWAYEELIPFAVSPASSINLAGVNSINVSWNAPAGYMYVVNPPSQAISGGPLLLQFEAQYGLGFQAASLGSITASSISVHRIYGTSPIAEGVTLNTATDPYASSLSFFAGQPLIPNATPFAFTSITVSANFSGTGTDTTLPAVSESLSSAFGSLYGVYLRPDDQYPGPAGSGNGQLFLRLQPLPSNSISDNSSTLALAGLGFAGLLLLGRRLLPVNQA